MKATNVRGSIYEGKFIVAKDANAAWVTEYTEVKTTRKGKVLLLRTGGLGKNVKLGSHRRLLNHKLRGNEYLRGAGELLI